MSRRSQWRREVSRAEFPIGMRPVKATLLSITDLVTVDGRLSVWRDQLIDETGLPSRTVDRHIEKAVTTGWLHRVTPGGYKRRAVYLLDLPETHPARHKWRTGLCATHYAQDCRSCAPRCGELNTDTASVSEHQAVQHRDEPAADIGAASTVADRNGTAATTQGATRRLRVADEPTDHRSAERHDLTRSSRIAGLSPGAGRRPACAGLRKAA